MGSHWWYRIVQSSLLSLAVLHGGFICLHSHRQHWTVKSSLCALAVPTGGGSICLWYLYIYICTGISLYFLISWLFQMGSHWQYRNVQSSLLSLAVLHGGRTSAKVGSSAKFELTSCFMLCFTEGLFILHMKDLMNIFPSISWETPLMCVETLRTRLIFLRWFNWGVTCLGLVEKWTFSHLCAWKH